MAKSVKVNFVYQAGYQVLLILIPLITTPYLSRTLGAEGVGVYSYTYAITSYFVMFSVLGISTYGVREIAACGADRRMRSFSFWSMYFSQLMVGTVVVIAYIIYCVFFPQGGVLIAGVWGLWVLSSLLDISWLMFGVEEFKIPTTLSAITKLISVAVIFGFVHSERDLWIYCLAIAGSYLANQVFIWLLVRRYVDYAKPSWDDIKKHFKPNIMLFIPVIAISLYTSMDKILLGAIAGMEQAGFFEYSEKLSKMPMAVVTAMGTVMLPRMTSLLSSGQRQSALELLEVSVWAMLAMAFALAFGISAIAPEFAPVFFGSEFADCDALIIVLSITIPVISLTNVIGRQFLVPMGRDRFYTMSVCVGAMVNVAVNLTLIPSYGAIGAAIATVAAEISVLVVQAWSVRGELPFLCYIQNSLPFVAIGAIMLVLVRVFATWWNGFFGMGPLGLAAEVVVGVIVYAALSLLWCVATNNSMFRQAFKRLFRRTDVI